MKEHQYKTHVEWTGDLGEGTRNYKSYTRDYSIAAEGKSMRILGSSDPSFLGDSSRYNPEELFLASLSSCHMLWYLHLCSTNKIVITSYEDSATGNLLETKDGSGAFSEVTLHPRVIVTEANMIEKAISLHHEASKMCFIANSCNFEVKHDATVSAD